MKNKTLKVVIVPLIIFINLFIGCGIPKEETEKKSLSGYITVSGSTSIKHLIEKSAEKFRLKYPNINIIVQGGDSETGLTQLFKGSIDVGNSDIDASKKLNKEEVSQLVDNKIVAEGFAIVTSNDVNIKSLTKKNIAEIFSGAKTNWKDFGGEDKKIILVHRPSSSGTRNVFLDKILDGKKEFENDKIGVVQDSSENVKTTLETTKGAISYIGLNYVRDEKTKKLLNVLKIEDIEPNYENISNGSYPFWSFAHMYTKGEANKVSKEFISYIKSEENKNTVKTLGFAPISDIKTE